MKKEQSGGFPLGEILKYGVVGVVSTVIDMGLLKILTMIGLPVWIAVAAGFLAGTINGYFMNSRWTFAYKTKGREAAKFSQFAIISLIGLGLTEIIVNLYLANFQTGLVLFGHSISATMTGKLIAVAIVFVWNYLGNKLWTFKKQD